MKRMCRKSFWISFLFVACVAVYAQVEPSKVLPRPPGKTAEFGSLTVVSPGTYVTPTGLPANTVPPPGGASVPAQYNPNLPVKSLVFDSSGNTNSIAVTATNENGWSALAATNAVLAPLRPGKVAAPRGLGSTNLWVPKGGGATWKWN
jgi:hypothetical protein